jgi:glycosyltransferase 2 family protein
VSAAPPKRSVLDWKAIVGILLSAVLLYWALRDVDLHKVVEEIRHANPLWFTAAVAITTAVFWLRAWRWGPLLSAAFPNATYQARLRATMIGFMANNVLPARIGEFARAFALARQARGSVVAAFASLLTERLFDAIAIVSLLFIATALPGFPAIEEIGGRDFSTMANTAAAVVLGLIILAAMLVLWPKSTVRFFEMRVAQLLPEKARRPLVDALEAFLAGMGSLRSPAVVVKIMIQTYIVWVVNGLSFYCAFRAFGIDASFGGALFLQSVTALFVSLPSAPGFFGFFESAARIVLVELFGIPVNKTLGFAIGFHIGGFIPVTVIGLYFAWKLGLSWKEMGTSERTVEEAVEAELPAPTPPKR